ncbi:unnamed protein product [Phytophthora fragariaefolia]|uniref:Unnamed protein product n=1 Tax=Phytophthora fragariaefolia TaxID=1490495 RepID=A0A9W6XCN6_9STRA|nr:unnamed protein product [Phytophthora fragariaefolia]
MCTANHEQGFGCTFVRVFTLSHCGPLVRNEYSTGFVLGPTEPSEYLSLKRGKCESCPSEPIRRSDSITLEGSTPLDLGAELSVPGRIPTPYNPWVHASRLKPHDLFPKRPTVEIEVADNDDFAAALLPEDSWKPDSERNEYEVEKILDLWWSKRIRTSRRTREYLVKWKGTTIRNGYRCLN